MLPKQKLLLPAGLLAAVAVGDHDSVLSIGRAIAAKPLQHDLSSHLSIRALLKRRFAAAVLAAFGLPDLNADSPAPPLSVKPAQKPRQKPVSLLTAIARKGGIALGEILDLTGESRAIIRPGMFRKSGEPFDDLATRLRDDGFDIPHDTADGGVQALRNMIRDELDGRRKHYSFGDAELAMESEYHAKQKRELEESEQ